MFNVRTLNEPQIDVNVARPREERSGRGFRPQHRNRNNSDMRVVAKKWVK